MGLFNSLWYRFEMRLVDQGRARDVKEAKLIGLFVEGEPPDGSRGVYPERFTLRQIKERLQGAGVIKDPNSLVGRPRLCWELFRCHEVGYWKGYFFKRVGPRQGDDTVYMIERTDVSGLGPA